MAHFADERLPFPKPAGAASDAVAAASKPTGTEDVSAAFPKPRSPPEDTVAVVPENATERRSRPALTAASCGCPSGGRSSRRPSCEDGSSITAAPAAAAQNSAAPS